MLYSIYEKYKKNSQKKKHAFVKFYHPVINLNVAFFTNINIYADDDIVDLSCMFFL